MRFTIPAETFALAVQSAAPAASKRGSVEILKGSLWRADSERGVSVTCCDMQTMVTATVPGEVLEDGVACIAVPTAAQLKALKALKGETVTVTVADDAATLTAGSTSCTLRLAVLEDYPLVQEMGDGSPLDAGEFSEVLAAVLPSASTDESRPVLCGVLFEAAESGVLTLATTDSYRLRIRSMMAPALPAIAPVIPAVSLKIVAKQLARKGAELTTGLVGGQHVGFRVVSDGLELVTVVRTFDGQFPNWRQLLPVAYDGGVIEVDRAGMVKTVGKLRALVSARDNTPIRMAVSGVGMAPKIEMSYGVDDVTANDSVGFTANGNAPEEPREYGVNPEYWQEGFESFTEDTVKVGLISPLRPMMVLGERHDAAGLQDCYLVMPIRLAG
jgi:DNA polymerase-3 subunit beta